MYGKHYASTYTGSMYGAGVFVFAVWGYVIANTDKEGYVELNPLPLASALGDCTPEDVEAAIQLLASPDPNSRSQEEDGRRLVEEGAFLYRVVNYQKYSNLRTAADRREYLRVKKRESRERLKKQGQGNDGHPKAPVDKSASTELDLAPYFKEFWDAYPSRAGGNPKKKAEDAFRVRVSDGVDPEVMVDAVRAYAAFCEATGKLGTETVKQARYWLSPTYEGWLQDWSPPPEADDLAFPDYPTEVGGERP